LCAKCDIHRAANGLKWLIGFLNPMILSLGGFDVWIRITRNIIDYLFGCLASSTSVSVDALGIPLSWKQPFLLALEEPDKQKLAKLVRASEQAIFLRRLELNNSSDHHEERSEMSVAEVALPTIKTHKLGWTEGAPFRFIQSNAVESPSGEWHTVPHHPCERF
jgi:hypothetical protein